VIAITKACEQPHMGAQYEFCKEEHGEELSYGAESYGAENRMAKPTAINKD
jgi:hypothetical protein